MRLEGRFCPTPPPYRHDGQRGPNVSGGTYRKGVPSSPGSGSWCAACFTLWGLGFGYTLLHPGRLGSYVSLLIFR